MAKSELAREKSDSLHKKKKGQLHTQVVFDIHEALRQKAAVLEEEGPKAASNKLHLPTNVRYQSVHLGEINVKLQINEKKQNRNQALKIKFQAQMEFLTNSEIKKNRDKNFHLYIFEEIPVLVG